MEYYRKIEAEEAYLVVLQYLLVGCHFLARRAKTPSLGILAHHPKVSYLKQPKYSSTFYSERGALLINTIVSLPGHSSSLLVYYKL